MEASKLEEIVLETIAKRSESLESLSRQIFENPELKFEETFAHNLLTDYLENAGFVVEKQFILPTAFKAVFTNTKESCTTVAVICEYDALPEIGHACGHNLIAEAGIAVALAVKSVLETVPSIKGKIVVLGTPGEEGGGGKIILGNAGAFDDIDLSIIVHPSNEDLSAPMFNCSYPMSVVFKGKESHAGFVPWEGLNALDAAVSCYVNVSLLRQQIKPDWRINMIIKDGGRTINVIPQSSEIQFLLRTPFMNEIELLKSKIANCYNAAATTTGCDVEVHFNNQYFYKNVLQNCTIEERFSFHGRNSGMIFPVVPHSGPSTDYGNVSHIIPSLHPVFGIGPPVKPHSVEFAQAAGATEAQPYVRNIAKVAALTLLDFFQDEVWLQSAKESFKKQSLTK